jgi:hypothetical protein
MWLAGWGLRRWESQPIPKERIVSATSRNRQLFFGLSQIQTTLHIP